VPYDDPTRLVEKVLATGGQAELEVGEDMMRIWPVFDFVQGAQARDGPDRRILVDGLRRLDGPRRLSVLSLGPCAGARTRSPAHDFHPTRRRDLSGHAEHD
jgi:hypothetical protein